MVINDIDLSVYAETRCPDPSSPTGYGEPIASPPVGPITNGFIPTPGTITANVVDVSYSYSSNKISCSDGATILIPANVQSFSTTYSVSNVTGYRPLSNVVAQGVVCSDRDYTVSDSQQVGVLLQRADGTTVVVGATVNGGTVYSTSVSGVNRYYRQISISYGSGTSLYDPPEIPDPPNPPL
jgi:hypothetical protein